jgi:hypothetical protein
MYALAVFNAHIEYDVGGTWAFEDGPERVAIEEALAWARERADKLVVQWFGPDGTTHASAGTIPVGDGPPWEPRVLVPRRIPGWEHLDRTENDDPISWEVVARAVIVPAEQRLGEALTQALRVPAGGAVVAVKVEPASLPKTGTHVAFDNAAVHLRLVARTYDEACRLATNACASATRGLGLPDDGSWWAPELAQAYPSGSRAAENADVEQRGWFY